MKRVVAIAIPKGGTGKTSTAVTLASAADRYNRRALLVDLDPQAHCSPALGVDRAPGVFAVAWEQEPLAEHVIAARPGCDLLPGTPTSTAEFQDKMVSDPWGVRLLDNALEGHAGPYDLTFLDCPPTEGRLNAAALAAAGGILIPTQCNFLGLESLAQFLVYLDQLHSQRRIEAEVIAILPTFYDVRTKASKEAYKTLLARFGALVSEPIPRATAVERAAGAGQTLWEYCPDNAATRAYESLADWLYTRWL